MFNTHFSYIVAVRFIGGGNWRKPLTFLKSQDKIYHMIILFLLEFINNS
jgi:hypothetical protein